MDKYEDTVVNPNISLNNFEVKVREDVKIPAQNTRVTTKQTKKTDSNFNKSVVLLVLLAAIFVFQLSMSL